MREGPIDVVLSSGFLAFARHLGFLSAIEASGLEVQGVCGTSSGALIGSMWASGMSLDAIRAELTTEPPARMIQGHWRLWRGLFIFDRVLVRLKELLPPRFEDLDRPFGVGVRGPGKRHVLLTSGALPEAVAASCAIPFVFAPVCVDGVYYQDGGAVDRYGIAPWMAFRGDVVPVVHRVEASLGREGEGALDGLTVAHTPRSGASFWNLGDVQGQIEEARALTEAALRGEPEVVDRA